jgi:hypothetical protein
MCQLYFLVLPGTLSDGLVGVANSGVGGGGSSDGEGGGGEGSRGVKGREERCRSISLSTVPPCNPASRPFSSSLEAVR